MSPGQKKFTLRSTCEPDNIDDPELVGDRILDLLKLRRNSIPVTETIILPKTLFEIYVESDSIPGAIVDTIVEAVVKLTPHSKRAFVRHSTNGRCLGLIDKIVTPCDYSNLKYSIERIYRSWFEDRARAHRIANGISEADSVPAVFIQKYHKEIYSLTTRNGRSGESTTEENFRNHVANTAHVFTRTHQTLLRAIESTIGSPSEVHFSEEESLSVCGIKAQAISEQALLKVLMEYHEEGAISTLQLLKRIKPSMLGHLRAYQLTPDTVTARGSGLPISSGVFLGKLIIRHSINTTVTGGHVLALDECSPEDVHLLMAAGGVILTRGGMTSHAALICRGIGTPAITLDGATIDVNEKRIYLRNGSMVREGSAVLLDGAKGTVEFADASMLETRYGLSRTASQYSNSLVSVLSKFESPDALRPLPVEEQLHLAKLQARARKVGLIS